MRKRRFEVLAAGAMVFVALTVILVTLLVYWGRLS